MLDHHLPFQSLYAGFDHAAARWPDREIVRDTNRLTTYRALRTASRAGGRALLSLGVELEDRICIWGGNHTDWIVAGLSIQAAGATLIPAGTRLKGREVAAILRRVEARILFCDPGFGSYDFVQAILAEPLPELEHIVVFDDRPRTDRVVGWATFLSEADAVDEIALDQRISQIGPDTLADILFTSGTTGVPKGVPTTHGQSLVACEQQQLCVSNFVEGDVFAVTYAFAHNAGYRAGWQVGVLFGVPIIPVRDCEPLALLQLVDREKVSILPAVPTIYQGLLDHPRRTEFSLASLRRALTGATTIPVPLIERMQSVFGIDAVVTGYGLTEAAGSVTSTRPGDSAQVIALTVGARLEGLDMKIVDPGHLEVPHGETGEVAVLGVQVMRGYYRDPEATSAAFTSDGFLLTGDLGVMDDAGNLSITGRIKDMYIVGGFNAYPAEIEQEICHIDGVADVAVVGIDDERLGQVGRAFVVRRPGATVDEALVVAWCRERLANYKVPRVVTFLDALPRNATGKVAKPDLRSLP